MIYFVEMIEPGKTLFIGEIPFVTTDKQIRHAFEPYGLITAIRIKRGKGKMHSSYAFIEYTRPEEAMYAIQRMDGVTFLGKVIR